MADRYPQLRKKVIEVLKSAETQKINFYFAGQNFGPSGWSFAAHVVLLGQTPGRGVQIRVEQQGTGVEASYNFVDNALSFPRSDYGSDENQIFERSSIVHECVHVCVDGQATAPTPGARFRFGVNALNNEIAAYIAGHLYMIYEAEAVEQRQLKRDGISVTVTVNTPPNKKSIHACARIVAQKLRDKPGATVPDDADLANLRAAILASTSYADLKQDPNKIDGSPGIRL